MASSLKVFSVLVIASCLNTVVWAQSGQLEEIVVTAQKREQNLQDVPISISVMTGEQIRDLKITNAKELSNYIPNFAVIRDPIGDKINIRGVQSGNLASFEQAVSTYVDGIYRGRGAQSRLSYMDVGSIEVLRGPQGALFGKNTIGGAVSVTSARPTDELSAELSGSYNNDFDATDINGFISGGITSNLRGRFAFQDQEMDEGWVHNSFYDQDIPQSDENGGRAILEWDVTDATLVMLKYEYSRWHGLGQPWTLITTGYIPGVEGGTKYNGNIGNNGSFVVNDLGQPASVVGNIDPIDFGSNNSSDGDNNETMLKVEHQFDNQSTLTLLTGYSTYDFKRSLDADYNPLPGLRYDDKEDYEQASVEIRFASNTGETLEYLGGLYYQHDSLKVDGLGLFNATYLDYYIGQQCANGGGTTGRPDVNFGVTDAYTANNCSLKVDSSALVAFGIDGVNRYHYMKQDTDTYAAFGQMTWNIRDDLRTTGGLRYTYDEKSAEQGVWAADYGAGNTEQTFNPLLVAVAEGLGEFITHNYDDLDRSEGVVTWSLNLQWDATEDTMLYSSVSTGYKSGGFNSFYLESAGSIEDRNDAEFDKETSPFSAEVGAKMILADGAADLNVAVFYTKFDDLQAAIFSGSTSFLVQNAARADTRGVEIDGRWQLTDRLLLQGSAAYLDFTYDHFPNQACTNEQFVDFREAAWQFDPAASSFSNQDCAEAEINDVAGQTSENNPRWQANVIAQHTQPIGEFELMSLLALTYQDAQYRQGDLDPILKDEQYVKVDLSLMFGPASGRWQLAVIGRNLTDQTTYSYGNDAPFFEGARQVYMDQPRNYAVRATIRY